MEKTISSVNNPIIKAAAKLKQKKYRNLLNQYLVEGYHLVEEAYNSNLLETVFYCDEFTLDFANSFQVTLDVMKKLSDLKTPPGIVGICKNPENQELSDHVLILDNVQDPGNIGTLLRTAAAFDFNTVIAENSVDFFNEKVIRSSQGAIFKLNLLNLDIKDFISKETHQFLVTDLKSKTYLKHMKLNKKVALILGNEGSGVSDEIFALCKEKIKIKMANMESLNVGIAGGIIMHEIYQRSEG